jgi:hypothetical protein
MSTISGWLGSGAGVVVIGLCIIMMIFIPRLPGWSHQWVHRLLIAIMYCGGSALAVTTLGGYVLEALGWIAGWFGGTTSGIGYVTIVVASSFLLLTVAVCLIWEPDPGAAYLAAGLPLVLALVPGGFLHAVYVTTSWPAQQATLVIAHWVGG